MLSIHKQFYQCQHFYTVFKYYVIMQWLPFEYDNTIMNTFMTEFEYSTSAATCSKIETSNNNFDKVHLLEIARDLIVQKYATMNIFY